jgi:hypothetical protein
MPPASIASIAALQTVRQMSGDAREPRSLRVDAGANVQTNCPQGRKASGCGKTDKGILVQKNAAANTPRKNSKCEPKRFLKRKVIEPLKDAQSSQISGVRRATMRLLCAFVIAAQLFRV